MALITVKQAGGGDFTTIDDALASIGTSAGDGANDIVEVYNGTYTEGIVNTLPSGTSWGAPFIIRAATGQAPVIKNSGESNIRLYEPAGLAFFSIIQGFIFDGTDLSNSQILFGAVDSGPSSVKIISCELINTDFYNGMYIGDFCEDIHIISNEVHGGEMVAVDYSGGGWGHGIYSAASNSVIDSNLVYDIQGFGIQEYSSLSTPSGNIIRSNRIYNCGVSRHIAAGIGSYGDQAQIYFNVTYNIPGGDGDGGVGISVGGEDVECYNNTIYGCTYQGLEAAASTGASIKNNIAYNNGTNLSFSGATSIDDSNNFTANPNFVNVGTGDFHLQAGSLAINFGVNVGLPFSGPAPDAGAFEFTNLPPTSGVQVGSTLMMGGRMGMR